MPRSVMIPAIRSAGVTSKAGLCTSAPGAASTSSAPRSSIGIAFAVTNLLLHHYVREGKFDDLFAFLDPLIKNAMGEEDEWLIGFLLRFRGLALNELGQYESAVDACRMSSENLERVGSTNGKLLSICWMCLGQAREGDYKRAIDTLIDVEKQAKDTGDDETLGNAYFVRAYCNLQKGDSKNLQKGLKLGERALEIVPKEDYFRHDFCLEVAADLCFELGKLDEALRYSKETIEMAEINPSPYMPERRFFIHSKVLRALGHDSEADDYLQRAYERVLLVADNIFDEEMRRGWLENVKINREILEACGERGIGV